MVSGARVGGGRQTGVVFVVLSSLLFSSAGIFTKIIVADAWTTLFWRGVVAAIFLSGILIVSGRVRREMFGMGWSGIAVAVVSTLGSAAFIPAFKETTVANVVLIYATSPFLAALVAWLTIRERPGRRCLVSAGFAVLGVAVIVGSPNPGTSLKGDGLAVVMTICMAVMMVLYRRYPHTPSFGPMILSSLLVLPAGMVLSEPLSASSDDYPLLVGFGVCFALASVLLMSGAKRLPSSETALLSSLETPLAPILAWIVLAETMTGRTFFGGMLVVAALMWFLAGEERSLHRGVPATKSLE